MHTSVALAALLVGFVSLGAAARQVPDPDVQKIGPQVGETVPDFELIDQNGATRTLKSLLGPNGAMLVFFRAGRARATPRRDHAQDLRQW
ncbi:MAG: hypothetical protein H0W24_08140 [Lysobacter sp.]|nr:hypothetical protein [Lysobacter sp.]MBA3641347.1 hypothetical protein [Acidobacteriota bacterium]